MSSIDSNGTIGYLGPRGTFTEQALCSQADLATLNLRPHGSIVEVLRAAERGDVTYGFAAIENMIEGSVNATLDTLAFDAAELLIQRTESTRGGSLSCKKPAQQGTGKTMNTQIQRGLGRV